MSLLIFAQNCFYPFRFSSLRVFLSKRAKNLKFILDGDLLHLFTAILSLAAAHLHGMLHQGLGEYNFLEAFRLRSLMKHFDNIAMQKGN